jgi:hypothetical protein
MKKKTYTPSPSLRLQRKKLHNKSKSRKPVEDRLPQQIPEIAGEKYCTETH